MIRTIHFLPNGINHIGVALDQVPTLLNDPAGLLWVDFQGEEPKVCEPILLKTFKFHPLAVDDALSESHVPKLDDWEQYLYVVLHAIHYAPEGKELETLELDVFLGSNYVVTHHDLPIPSLDRVWQSSQKDMRQGRTEADHLLYHLSDELVVDYMNTVEQIDDAIEEIEDQVFKSPSPETVQLVFTLKKTTLHLRRVLSPLREVFNKLARDEYFMIDPKDRIYFRDVYDHLVRLHDISESLRDLVSGVLDTYLSIVNNRMNEIMKVLTMITTLFMPISFVAGFFGMNFFQPVEAGLAPWTGAFPFVLIGIIMVASPFAMTWWMRRRGWA